MVKAKSKRGNGSNGAKFIGRATISVTGSAEPPQVNLFFRHGIALAEAAEYLADHFNSLVDLIPEGHQDKVLEPQVFKHMSESAAMVREATGRLSGMWGLTDEMYREAVEASRPCVEFEPVEAITEFLRARRWREDELAAIGSNGGGDTAAILMQVRLQQKMERVFSDLREVFYGDVPEEVGKALAAAMRKRADEIAAQ